MYENDQIVNKCPYMAENQEKYIKYKKKVIKLIQINDRKISWWIKEQNCTSFHNSPKMAENYINFLKWPKSRKLNKQYKKHIKKISVYTNDHRILWRLKETNLTSLKMIEYFVNAP